MDSDGRFAAGDGLVAQSGIECFQISMGMKKQTLYPSRHGTFLQLSHDLTANPLPARTGDDGNPAQNAHAIWRK